MRRMSDVTREARPVVCPGELVLDDRFEGDAGPVMRLRDSGDYRSCTYCVYHGGADGRSSSGCPVFNRSLSGGQMLMITVCAATRERLRRGVYHWEALDPFEADLRKAMSLSGDAS